MTRGNVGVGVGVAGVDLAWSANGYVYHTALDTAARVPPAALQRTGDNVLALARGTPTTHPPHPPYPPAPTNLSKTYLL